MKNKEIVNNTIAGAGGTNMNNKGITKRSEDFSRWYSDVIEAAGLAEHAPVRGCMIIKPYGYLIWENIVRIMDKMLKEIDVENAYFPLLIPENFLKKETEHVEGFSPELAVVTHGGGKKLDEPLIVRPTSETIIYDSFSRWIKSYRDLPMTVNQWSNIVRWEMRPRLFLRTTEFLWQEGHTAHATAEEAENYALMILKNIYQKFVEEYLAMPVYIGKKSEKEKFAGAKQTFCMEALMQDGKSLQSGTTHDLSDNFSKSFNVVFLDEFGKQRFVFQTSWGVSTRLIGGIIMSHSDDIGLVLPPKIAPVQVVITPIFRNPDDETVAEAVKIFEILKQKYKVKVDLRPNIHAGEKYYEWERKGVPIRVEIGPKDLIAKQCIIVRRDTNEKLVCAVSEIATKVGQLLETIQDDLFNKAVQRREQTNQKVDDWQEFQAAIKKGGYVFVHWCEDTTCEIAIKEKTKASTRCRPFDMKEERGEHICVHCGKKSPSNRRWIFAKAY